MGVTNLYIRMLEIGEEYLNKEYTFTFDNLIYALEKDKYDYKIKEPHRYRALRQWFIRAFHHNEKDKDEPIKDITDVNDFPETWNNRNFVIRGESLTYLSNYRLNRRATRIAWLAFIVSFLTLVITFVALVKSTTITPIILQPIIDIL